ncbi:hypothetical protein ACHAWF_005492 [Thalassiosira exigua]
MSDETKKTALEDSSREDANSPSKSKSKAKDDEKEKALASSKPSLWRVFKMAIPEMPMLVASFLLMIGSESTNMITPLVVANAYDVLVDPTITDDAERMADINWYMMIAVIITLVGIVAGFLRATIQGVIGERVVARLRCTLYSQILKQEIAFFDEHKSGELISRLGSDTTLLQSVVSQSLPDFFPQMIKSVTGIVLMFYISPNKQYQDILGEAQNHSTEAIGSMRTVQAFSAEQKESSRYNSKIDNPDNIPLWWPPKGEKTTYSVGFYKSIAQSSFFTFVFGAGFGFLNVTLWYGFYLVIEDEMSLGGLTAFNSYVISIGFAMGQMAGSIAKVFEGLGASGRIFYLVDRVPQIPPPLTSSKEKPKAIKPESMTGRIEFENVTFSYPTRPTMPVLKGVSLTIPPNTTTALVGSSGSGKSTIVSLLQRFYDNQGGRITIDGHDMKDLDLVWLRSQIGYVQQEPNLFGLTIRENML